MEDSSDSLSDLFKKPDAIRYVQNQSRVSESSVSLSLKDNAVLNVGDSDSVLLAIFRKPKELVVSSTNSVPQEVTPNLSTAQNINSEDTAVCKKKKSNFNVLQSANCTNIFENTPNSLCESVAKLPKRERKCLKNADTKVTSLSVQFSVCDTTESSVVLPEKQFARRSAADRRTRSRALSLFDKREPTFLSHTFSPAHNLRANTSNGLESSVAFTKKKSTLKGSERFSTTNLFGSEPSSVSESFIEKRKTRRFRDDSTHHQFSPKNSLESSNVEDGNEVKLTRKPLVSFVGKENVDVNFDNTVSSVSDAIVLKSGGGFLNTLKKTKDCSVNASENIFGLSENLSDDHESNSESEESEKDPSSNNTCDDESSSSREPESTNRSASMDEDESSTSYKEPESIQKSTSSDQEESIANEGVSFAQPADCTPFISSSGSQTQTSNSSVSLVSKMCKDKSTVGKMLPPKRGAPKKIREELRFLFESDSSDESADNSLDTLPKKPDFPKFHPWCGKQFYGRIIEKMRPKYGVRTNLEAVRLAKYVWRTVKQVVACRDADANHEKVEEMKRILARKQIVVTHYQFYIFCVQNLPQTFHLKALPMGPHFPCKFDLAKTFDPILADS